MLSITKFIGVIIVFFGTVLLMSCYDSNINKDPLDVIALGLAGLLVVAMGVICWMWCEPYEQD